MIVVAGQEGGTNLVALAGPSLLRRALFLSLVGERSLYCQKQILISERERNGGGKTGMPKG